MSFFRGPRRVRLAFARASVAALLAIWPPGFALSRCAAAETVEFGTDARGKPITWTMVFPAEPRTTSMRVDDKGQLHLKFGPERTVPGKTDAIEIKATDVDFFGAQENQTPWVEFNWTDANVHGRIPSIDVIAEDTRPEKMDNRVLAGALFKWARIGYARYTMPDGETKEESYAGNGARADEKVHTARVGKLADGTIWFLFDGKPYASTFLKKQLGADHSAWGTLWLRIHSGEQDEEYVFPSLKMGANFQAPPADAVKPPQPVLPPITPRARVSSQEGSSWPVIAGAIAAVGLVWLLVLTWRRR